MTVISKDNSKRLNAWSFAMLEYAFYAVLIIRALTAVYILSGNMSDTQEISRFFFLDAFISSVIKLLDAVLDYIPEPQSKRPKKSSIHKLKTLFLFVVRRKRK